ncbi:porin [Massilia endophytica]|uniref:porin n=1 Tax=Massilia endophytica TaxID=2899220 RepID=UPI001E36EE1B|nr:porin [Massilia endophytica]UGQ48148.1 porin [Massilia endophytica]
MRYPTVSIPALRVVLAAGLALPCMPCLAAGWQLHGHLGVSLSSIGGAASMGDDMFDASALRLTLDEALAGGVRLIARMSVQADVSDGAAGFTGLDQSILGLQWERGVTITVGRQYSSAIDSIADFLDVFEVGGSSVHVLPLALLATNRFDGFAGKQNGSVKLRWQATPEWHVSVSAADASHGAGRSESAAVQYRAGACAGAALTLRNRGPSGAGRQDVAGAGGHCKLGAVQLYAALYRMRLAQPDAGWRERHDMAHAGLRLPLDASSTLAAGYYLDRGAELNGVAGRAGAKQTFAATLTHNLGLRARLYVAAFSNGYTGGYRDEIWNIRFLGRLAGAARVRGVALGGGLDF